jgi:hypothetical protein
MKSKSPKSIGLLAIVLLFSVSIFTACNSGDKKKEEPAKTDTPPPPPVEQPKPAMDDTVGKGTGDTLKQKPTEQGD